MYEFALLISGLNLKMLIMSSDGIHRTSDVPIIPSEVASLPLHLSVTNLTISRASLARNEIRHAHARQSRTLAWYYPYHLDTLMYGWQAMKVLLNIHD